MDIIRFTPHLSHTKNTKKISSPQSDHSRFSLHETSESHDIPALQSSIYVDAENPVALAHKGLNLLADLQISILSSEGSNSRSFEDFFKVLQKNQEAPEPVQNILRLTASRMQVEMTRSNL